MKKIAVFGINQLGGLMMATPFFRELRRGFPDANIINIVSPLTYNIMQVCPHVDSVWCFDKRNTWALIRRLKQERVDLALILSGTFRTVAMSFLAGIPNRVGFEGEDGASWLLTQRVPIRPAPVYRTERAFDLLRAVGLAPEGVYDREAWVSDQDRAAAAEWYAREVGKGPALALNPYSTDIKRRWRDDHWKVFVRSVLDRGIRPVMLVAPSDYEASLQLRADWGLSEEALPVAALPVGQTLAALAHFHYAIGVDSGFMHMALASGGPRVIGLFNTLSPEETFPLHDDRHSALTPDVPCFPCNLYRARDICPHQLKCLDVLSAQQALDVLDRWRNENGPL